ncbi:MoaF-related domain-containing protein [Fulvivirga sedimenti]|uniref:MoaF N-terminal domain-containing protein n=1 Tax=Fulvivirga sedimenti TaxID=2879465 RepID=A0A9X1KVP8_9BACT|nr:MoaF N-terminal domain-containing protein [Fulvivirga sedimenti]MCA6075048.1 MoaF N-terminal domain-containing protein [Fulvivirga sedimenti]MCA6076225.1 MoaF N-terminal domain-containing protein [Fulvivirga sedimenti]MCA6077353.1 MoaF N-terminal domain-containing protein [Fulvivirga sedimenti]
MNQTNPLDGKTITYTYDDLGTVRVSFKDGLVSFEWIAGPFAGMGRTGIDYNAKLIVPGIWFINWYEKNDASFVTLLINLNDQKVHSSGLLNATKDDEAILFHEAKIESSGF